MIRFSLFRFWFLVAPQIENYMNNGDDLNVVNFSFNKSVRVCRKVSVIKGNE